MLNVVPVILNFGISGTTVIALPTAIDCAPNEDSHLPALPANEMSHARRVSCRMGKRAGDGGPVGQEPNEGHCLDLGFKASTLAAAQCLISMQIPLSWRSWQLL